MHHFGKCLCGAVRYQISGPITDVIYCHCSQCKKQSGSAFMAFGSVKHTALQISGADSLQSYCASENAERKFCRNCGSTLFWQHCGNYGKTYSCFALGTLDTEFKPQDWQHYYTDDKASWFEIQDGHRQYGTEP
ncbi:GFA family protein [Reinekea marinisedimentorum]|uniref:CENP-V/GFA domain-containing protein n=1 Tax=Reinekea marinisedimentorum TaxID=230495 RepID=A0A4R3IAX8_9GAMM|nr:GFA family protein [Reinekea marinisedimentorum]TCS43749.1 hypothetical protein BCF53_10192 [Reinekea marinisedimentorum]